MTWNPPASEAIGWQVSLDIEKKFVSEANLVLHQINESKVPSTNDLIFGATNLLLGAEIFLKIIVSMAGRPVPQIHDLWQIYLALTPAQRVPIRAHFSAAMEKLKERGGERRPLVVGVARVGQEAEAIQTSRQDPDVDLETVLKDSRDSYSTWRHLYMPLLVNQDSREIILHHIGLNAVCIAINSTVLHLSKEDGATNSS